jgi:hypothetical protein
VLESVEPFEAEAIEAALRGLAERLELKPAKAFQPIRVAVTGSKVSPGLFESIELLGKVLAGRERSPNDLPPLISAKGPFALLFGHVAAGFALGMCRGGGLRGSLRWSVVGSCLRRGGRCGPVRRSLLFLALHHDDFLARLTEASV